MESAIGNLEESVSIFAFRSDEYNLSALDIHDTSNIACIVKFCFLVSQVQKADGKLDMNAWQIDEFEKAFEEPEDEVGVRFSALI